MGKKKEKLVLRMQVATGLYPCLKTPSMRSFMVKSIARDLRLKKSISKVFPVLLSRSPLSSENPKKEKLPTVLNPHGHGGRLQDYGEKGVLNQIVIGAERFRESGRMPKIARCATLARMGCIAFLYDMIGYADNQQLSYELAHRFAKRRPEFEKTGNWGLYSAQAEMRLLSIFGLQTWNSIRALDFLDHYPMWTPKELR